MRSSQSPGSVERTSFSTSIRQTAHQPLRVLGIQACPEEFSQDGNSPISMHQTLRAKAANKDEE